jgi:dTDP-4-amino-4,6-dideoxygalactose transaminase
MGVSDEIALPRAQPWVQHAYHLFVIRSARRDELLSALEAAGIRAGIHYPLPLHRQPAYRHLEAGPFPEAERAAAEILSLPMYPHLRDDQVDFVADRVIEFVRR